MDMTNNLMNIIPLFFMLIFFVLHPSVLYFFCEAELLNLNYLDTARKRLIESKLQSLDPQSSGVDSYLKVLEASMAKRDHWTRSNFVPY